MKIYPGVAAQHIIDMNLISLDESGGSGSLRHVKNGNLPIDGWHIKNNGELVGWCAVFMKWGAPETHILIRPEDRRKKLGSRLYKLAMAKYPHMHVYPWSGQAEDFYDAQNHPNCQRR